MEMKRSGAMLGQEGDQEARSSSIVQGAMTVVREYRRGNWTLPETMLLIEAKKKVHDGDRHPADQGLARWRWVEDYCWRAGCWRSQNQCNDRWDNLMRDYKKVRAYEHAGAAGRSGGPSYWVMERAERKERCLPSNLLREIYEAMAEIVESRRISCGGGGAGAGPGGLFVGPSISLIDIPMQASPLAQVLPRPLDQETHCSPESPERKRLRPSLDAQPGSSTPTPPAGGTHRVDRQEPHGDESSDDEEDDVDDDDGLRGAIGRCTAILSGALESREAAEERRHREVMAVEERRSLARQARRDAGEQCMAGLAAAVSQLAGSMLALAANHKGPAAPK